MKKSKILKKVQVRMRENYESRSYLPIFICNVLIGVAGLQYLNYRRDVWSEARDIENDISVMLGKYETLDHWLTHGVKVNKELLTPENMYEYRQRFIKHLIKQYKAKGE